jgi:hypothetical protein
MFMGTIKRIENDVLTKRVSKALTLYFGEAFTE